ncbi:MAG: arsenate reductase ArsC [Desulfatibacillaceae bacterium]|nr:arsenate reductase ArsC [Desulfatibacillaceae bacterium]
MSKKIKILFLCTGNACRSQMAEGLTRHFKGDSIEAFSAGSAPHGVDPMAVESMAQIGIDISKQKSKHVSEFDGAAIDWAITLCDNAQKACPVFPPPAKTVHKPFLDPPLLAKNAKSREEALAHYNRVRDSIKAFVEELPSVLDGLYQSRHKISISIK